MTPDEALLYWERRKRQVSGLAHPKYLEAIDAAIKALKLQIVEEAERARRWAEVEASKKPTE